MARVTMDEITLLKNKVKTIENEVSQAKGALSENNNSLKSMIDEVGSSDVFNEKQKKDVCEYIDGILTGVNTADTVNPITAFIESKEAEAYEFYADAKAMLKV